MVRQFRKIKKSKTLADIRRIPKWARKKLGFTCEIVEFSYESLKHFIDADAVSVRSASCIPGIDRTAVTKWQE